MIEINSVNINRLDLNLNKIYDTCKNPVPKVASIIADLVKSYWSCNKICVIHIFPKTLIPFKWGGTTPLTKLTNRKTRINLLDKYAYISWFEKSDENFNSLLTSSEFFNGYIYLTPIREDDTHKAKLFLSNEVWCQPDFEFICVSGHEQEYISWQNPPITVDELQSKINCD